MCPNLSCMFILAGTWTYPRTSRIPQSRAVHAYMAIARSAFPMLQRFRGDAGQFRDYCALIYLLLAPPNVPIVFTCQVYRCIAKPAAHCLIIRNLRRAPQCGRLRYIYGMSALSAAIRFSPSWRSPPGTLNCLQSALQSGLKALACVHLWLSSPRGTDILKRLRRGCGRSPKRTHCTAIRTWSRKVSIDVKGMRRDGCGGSGRDI
jgi:hypothetical protein